MTHSLQQDTQILDRLLKKEFAYLGVLGPRRRTTEILLTLAGNLNLPIAEVDSYVETWMKRLHAPMGLDLGGDTPADIALSVIAEIQQNRHHASGIALREKRAQQSDALQYDLLKR